jgi:uncharacterized repeat protein (TIGR04138 family)
LFRITAIRIHPCRRPFPLPLMQKIDFVDSLDQLVQSDPRYHRDAYLFLRDALDFTVKQKKKGRTEVGKQHVRGPELLEGLRQYALKEFGPMVPTVFDYWGIRRCEDVGEMVFNLIRVGIFGKNEDDSISDFKGTFTFHEAFVAPFRPQETAAAAATSPPVRESVDRAS